MTLNRICAATLVVVGLFAAAAPARAAVVSWDVDAANSYVRLAIPDFSYNVDGLGNLPIRIRDMNGTGAWSDTNGRRAFLDGTISTNYNDFSSITFNSGLHNLFALEGYNARPNPAAFNPANTNANNPDGQYSNTSTAPAAFAASIRSQVLISVDVGRIAFRDVLLDMNGSTSVGPGGAIAGSTTGFGIEQAMIDIDGLTVVGQQPLPDTLNLAVDVAPVTNTGAGTITDMGGLLRKLTLSINIPIVIPIDDAISINGSATGQIVAYAMLVPEPSTVIMAGIATLGLCFAGRRRFRRA